MTHTSPADPTAQVIEIIAEQTGYGTDDIELDYELEADLGIDTVKQAEIFSMLQEQFGIGETDTQLSEVQTIAALIEWVKNNAAGNGPSEPPPSSRPEPVSSPAPQNTPTAAPVQAAAPTSAATSASGVDPTAQVIEIQHLWNRR